jgi:hypothetical protein
MGIDMQIEWSRFPAMRTACIETGIRSAFHLKLLVQLPAGFSQRKDAFLACLQPFREFRHRIMACVILPAVTLSGGVSMRVPKDFTNFILLQFS